MSFNIPQSTAYVVMFKAYLSSDGKTEATGKTIAITIAKAGGAFGNPNAGATNATEMTSGWYKFTLDTTDTNTLGGVAFRGAVATIDDAGFVLNVVSATTGGATNLDAAISGRASQTSVDDLPTNAELATALGTADDAVLAAIATVQSDTDNIQTRLPAALVSGRMDASVGAMAANVMTAAAAAADLTTELQAGLATAAALTTIDDFLDTEVAAIKAKTDSLTFTVAGQVDANIESVNAVTVTGNGSPGTEWGP